MPLHKEGWNVIVVGRWNRAILTPSGIARRLFNLAPETPIQVFVPLDQIAPFRVGHGNINVTVGEDRLTVEPEVSSFESLQAVKEIAATAITALPETPVFGAGINLRYIASADTDVLQRIVTHDWHGRIGDNQFEIAARGESVAIRWNNGLIRVIVDLLEDRTFSLVLNFDLTSKIADELRAWVLTPVDRLREAAERILRDCIELPQDEI